MNIRCIAADQLTVAQIEAWSAIQRANPALDSPYFRPEFTQAVAAARPRVEIAVLEDGGRPLGFFPYHRSRWNSAHPVAGRLTDFQGLIAPAGVSCDPAELTRACGLSAWHFTRLLAAQANFLPFAFRRDRAQHIDLASGFEAYIDNRANGRRLLAEHGKKTRKLGRELAPVRFEPHVADPQAFATLLEWKGNQFRRTQLTNLFEFTWVVRLLRVILEARGPDFSPMLSVLYVGDRMAAMCFCMRCGEILHPWFPAFDVYFNRYSVGHLLWIETIKAASALGVRRIDLGTGPEFFKQRYATGSTQVCEGVVDLRPALAKVRTAWRNTRRRLRSSRLAAPGKLLMPVLKRARDKLELRWDSPLF